MRHRTPIVLVLFVAAMALGHADQNRSRVLPIATPRDAAPENAIYFADMGRGVLVRVTDLSAAGWDEGPTAPGLQFHSPWHFTFDTTGRIVLADWENYRVVQMNDLTGNGWTAFTGTGSHTLRPKSDSYISSIGFDAQGRMYITGDGRVVRVDNMNGTGWTELELGKRPGEAGGSGNKDVVFDRQGRIYVTDNLNHRIVRFNDIQGTGLIAYGSHGMGVAQFNEPEGVALDSRGRIYVSDESNHRIVRIDDMTGAGWTTFGTPGHGDYQLQLPHGIQIDSLGRIYIADTGNGRIVRIDDMAGNGWVTFGSHRCATCNPPQLGRFFNLSPKGLQVRGTGATLTYQTVLPRITVDADYRMTLITMNPGVLPAGANVRFLHAAPGACRCSEPFPVSIDKTRSDTVDREVPGRGLAHFDLTTAGAGGQGYATVRADVSLPTVALLRRSQASVITAEAAVSASTVADDFAIYIDASHGASTAYSVVNARPVWPINDDWWNVGMTLTLRDRAGATVGTSGFNFGPGQPLVEFARDRFPQIVDGFEGTLQFGNGGNLNPIDVVALRYDNPEHDVLTSLPVVYVSKNPDVDVRNPLHVAIPRRERAVLYFPHVADGGTYRTAFLLMNPSAERVTATLQFFAGDGTPLALPIAGAARTQYVVDLAAWQVARIETDGSSESIKWGWARVTGSERIYWSALGGSAILQTVADGRITSEARVPSTPAASRISTYVDSNGTSEAGVAVANPNGDAANVTFTLYDESGAALVAAQRLVPGTGHLAQFVTQLFPGIGNVEGTLVVEADRAVTSIGLRYESVARSIFTTVPVFRLP